MDGQELGSDFTSEQKDGLYKAIFGRRDVRSHFADNDIEDEKLKRILKAAHHAPSVGFSQPWNFILIRDYETRKKIRESFLQERDRSAKKIQDQSTKDKYLSLKLEGILDSPVNLCVTYDHERFGPFVIGRSSVTDAGIYSVCCAIQNLWLAARSEGVGVGWVSILSNTDLRSILGIPERVLPIAYLCLGYVTKFEKKPDLERKKWLERLDLKDVVFYEKWNKTQDSSWDKMQQLIANDDNKPGESANNDKTAD